jgi:hypothetical protein
MANLKAPEPRRRTSSPSPLVAALAEAVLEQHARRAGLAPGDGAMSAPMEREKAEETSGVAASRYPEHPVLHVVEGGRRTQTEP